MSSTRQLHRVYGLFPNQVLNRETEEMMHDEGLLAHMVGDLELKVREAGGFGGEDVCAVVAVAWRTA